MINNTLSIKFNKSLKSTKNVVSSSVKQSKIKTEQEKQENNKVTINADYAIAAFNIHKSPTFGQKQKPTDFKQFIKDLSFSDKISPQDKRSLEKILQKNDKEADYTNKLINLIKSGKVNAYSLSHLCNHSQMSDLVKTDIDVYFQKVIEQKMSLEDAFVPKFSSQKEGQNSLKPGDVYRVEGKKNIFIKNGDNVSKELKIDSDTYIKLFPPVERYAGAQGSAGDCYLLSSINALMENPYTRDSIYDCFTQKGNSVTAKFFKSKTAAEYPDCKLPQNTDKSLYIDGAAGIQILEHLYGVDFEQQKFKSYSKVMNRELKKITNTLENLNGANVKDAATIKKQKSLQTKYDNYKKGQLQVEQAMKNSNHKLTFILDCDDDFIMGKYGPMFDDCDKMHSAYKSPADYYRGAQGGFTEKVLPKFGFEPEIFDFELDEEEIDDILFSCDVNDYIITAHTPSLSGEERENPINEKYSMYSGHEYKISPFDDENGKRKFKVTNPWNQSQQVEMNINMLKKYFTEISVSPAR